MLFYWALPPVLSAQFKTEATLRPNVTLSLTPTLPVLLYDLKDINEAKEVLNK
jgi:hypothetical protein